MALWNAMGSTNWRCTDRIRKPFRPKASAIAPRVKTRYGSVFAPAACAIRARERLEQRDARRRRIVDDDEPLGHAAQLGDASLHRGVCMSIRS
jgi:hypothetical protein